MARSPLQPVADATVVPYARLVAGDPSSPIRYDDDWVVRDLPAGPARVLVRTDLFAVYHGAVVDSRGQVPQVDWTGRRVREKVERELRPATADDLRKWVFAEIRRRPHLTFVLRTVHPYRAIHRTETAHRCCCGAELGAGGHDSMSCGPPLVEPLPNVRVSVNASTRLDEEDVRDLMAVPAGREVVTDLADGGDWLTKWINPYDIPCLTGDGPVGRDCGCRTCTFRQKMALLAWHNGPARLSRLTIRRVRANQHHHVAFRQRECDLADVECHVVD